MPTIPTYDTFQVAPNTVQGQFRMPDVPDVAGAQTSAIGNAMMGASGDMARIAAYQRSEQEKIEAARIDGALNALKEEQLELTFNKDRGYTNLTGKNALYRPDEKSIVDEYGERFTKRRDEISAGLTDRERQTFNAKADGMSVTFRGNLTAHQAQESRNFRLETAESIQSVAIREAVLNYGTSITGDANGISPAENALIRIEAQVYNRKEILGKSASWVDSEMARLTSDLHKMSIAQALEDGDVNTAAAYFKKYGDKMQPADIGAARKALQNVFEVQIGTQKGDAVASRAIAGSIPNESRHIFQTAVLYNESRGRTVNADGSPLRNINKNGTSDWGPAQVNENTAREGAKLAGLEWDEERYKNDPQYNLQIGGAIFDDRYKTFRGDPEKAVAAYNAGVGGVQNAIKKADAAAKSGKASPDEMDWRNHLPATTQKYLAEGMAQLQKARPQERIPTELEMISELRADPTLARNPRIMAQAEERIKKVRKLYVDDKTQREEEQRTSIFQALYKNGGDISALPQSVIAGLSDSDLKSVTSFADERARRGSVVVNNREAWAEFLSLPNDIKTEMTPSQFLSEYGHSLDDSHLEKGYAAIKEAQGKSSDKDKKLISDENRIKEIAIINGIIPSSGKLSKDQTNAFSQFRDAVSSKIDDYKRTVLVGKREPSEEEIKKIANDVMMDRVMVGSVFGIDTANYSLTKDQQKKAYVKVGKENIQLSQIPLAERAKIIDSRRQEGLPVTEQAIAEYWVKSGKPRG